MKRLVLVLCFSRKASARNGLLMRSEHKFASDQDPSSVASISSSSYTIHVRPEGSNYLDGKVPLDVVTTVESPATGRCLNFLHIPKTAGTTIGEMKVKYDEGHVAWGKQGWSTLKSCERPIESSRCASMHPSLSECCQITDASGHTGVCSPWHVPPVFDSAVASHYSSCDTFCVVRDPVTRAVSQHVYEGGICNVAAFESNIENRSRSLSLNPFDEDCHYVSQFTYIGHKPFCQRVLKYETLASDFASLMREYKLNLTLEEHRNAGNCDLTQHVDAISSKTVEWIRQFYAEDYKEFGYR